ncbi:hypothetical protein BXZ70DRAFT_1013017 [Cristinia sonorae]|uniref:Uncharacterized protein n=1 Tax=Cristinia sonorae TaxID=1940300 RepID=A0A8K0XK08_9AGAR|nr:hypothetical protein BXZ70DRAFT_1013017 [Cristinia sonorae]
MLSNDEYSKVVVTYAYELFLSVLAKRTGGPVINPPPLPSSLDSEMHEDCGRCVEMLVWALFRPLRLAWDVELYIEQLTPAQTGTNERLEHEILRRFPTILPNGAAHITTQPATVIDSMGRIVAWVVPGVLSEERMADITKGAQILEREIKRGHPTGRNPAAGWRSDPSFYKEAEETQPVSPGVFNMSPAWYESGHEYDMRAVPTTTPF